MGVSPNKNPIGRPSLQYTADDTKILQYIADDTKFLHCKQMTRNCDNETNFPLS
jgi:hypothetical protein